jgi:hypothetical protein
VSSQICKAPYKDTSTLNGYTEWYVGQNFKVFRLSDRCGIDNDKYAFAYAKRGKKPAIGCAVVIGGKTVINELMDL